MVMLQGSQSLKNQIKAKLLLEAKNMRKVTGARNVGKNPSNSIENVCLVDRFKFNLLWISQLCDKSNMVTFNSTQSDVSHLGIGNATLFRSIVGNVFVFNLDHVNSKNFPCFKAVNDDARL